MPAKPTQLLQLAVGLLAASGCAAFRNNSSARIYQAELPNGRTVEVQYDTQHSAFRGPDQNYVRATWYVIPKGTAGVIEHAQEQNGRVPELKFGRLEARGSEDGRYVWLVDLDAGRVIATMDTVTGDATGLHDAPPAWAQVGQGVRAAPKPG